VAFLGRLKKGRVDEDDDEEIDDEDEDADEDEDEADGGGLTSKLGKLRGLGKIGGAAGMLGKVMKRGGNDDDDDDDDDEDLSSVSVAPAAAVDLSENIEAADSAVGPEPGAGSAATGSVISLTEAPLEASGEFRVEGTADAVAAEEEKKAVGLVLGDILEEEELEVDPILRDLALSQDDTTAGQLLNELTAFLNQLENMVSN